MRNRPTRKARTAQVEPPRPNGGVNMRRFLTLVLAANLILGGAAATTMQHAQARTITRQSYCTYEGVDPGLWTYHEVRLTIRCAIRHFTGFPGYRSPYGARHVWAIAYRESGAQLAWYARNPSSGACGVFQHLPSLIGGRIDEFNAAFPRWHLHRDCYNARSNILAAVHMMHSGGFGPWGG